MIELDGILTIANGDAAALHGVDTVWQDTGYDGAGTTVAIIDTGKMALTLVLTTSMMITLLTIQRLSVFTTQ